MLYPRGRTGIRLIRYAWAARIAAVTSWTASNRIYSCSMGKIDVRQGEPTEVEQVELILDVLDQTLPTTTIRLKKLRRRPGLGGGDGECARH